MNNDIMLAMASGFAGLTDKEYKWLRAVEKGYDYERGRGDKEYMDAFVKRHKYRFIFYSVFYGVNAREVLAKFQAAAEIIRSVIQQ